MLISGAAGIGWSIVKAPSLLMKPASPPAERYLVFLAITLVTSILSASALGMFANQHYYVFLYPIVPIFFVWALERGLSALRAPAWWDAAIVGTICAAEVVLMLSFLEYLRTDPEVQSGSLSVYYAPKSAQCERELATRFDGVVHGAERRRGVNAEREKRFEASSNTLLRLDPIHNEPRVEPYGKLEIEPTPDGLAIIGGSALDMAALPEFSVPPGESAMMRLDLTSPDETIFMVFFQTLSDPRYSRRNFRDAIVERGRSTVFIELDGKEMTNRMHLRMEVYRYVIHALEVRAVAR
jgi:hypothetical protein